MWKVLTDGKERNATKISTMKRRKRKKRGNRFPHSLSKACLFIGFFLAEVALQQALERLAVAGLVAGHLVDGVVDGVQVELLGLLGQLELAGGGAVLGVHTHLQVAKRLRRSAPETGETADFYYL